MRSNKIAQALLAGSLALPGFFSVAQEQGSSVSRILSAASMHAGDCGARIDMADKRLGGSPGSVEVGAECGSSFTTPVVMTAGHSLRFTDGGTYYISHPITLGANLSLSGPLNASDDAPVRLVEAPGSNLPYLIKMSGHSVLDGLLLDGNSAENPKGQDVVLVEAANRVHILNTTIRNAGRDDLHITSADRDNSSGSGYLGPNVLLQYARRDAMFIERSADWIVGPQVEFESAARDGLHGEDSPTLRCSGCDFGGDGRYGAASITVNRRGLQSSGWVIVGSQFGNNRQGDFYANGSASSIAINGVHTLTGNAFIQSHTRPNAYDSITFIDAPGNTIAGNTWGFVQPSWASTYRYIILDKFVNLRGKQQYPTAVTGNNILPGTYGTGVFLLAQQDVTSGNVEGDGRSLLRNAMNLTNGFTGTKRIGSCVISIQNGIIISIAGC
jgi:hypothetical protein